jgi:hypothetical protein
MLYSVCQKLKFVSSSNYIAKPRVEQLMCFASMLDKGKLSDNLEKTVSSLYVSYTLSTALLYSEANSGKKPCEVIS